MDKPLRPSEYRFDGPDKPPKSPTPQPAPTPTPKPKPEPEDE